MYASGSGHRDEVNRMVGRTASCEQRHNGIREAALVDHFPTGR
jgi:hypothetical protein